MLRQLPMASPSFSTARSLARQASISVAAEGSPERAAAVPSPNRIKRKGSGITPENVSAAPRDGKRWVSVHLSAHDQMAEWGNVCLEEDQQAHERCQDDAVNDDVAQDTALVPIPISGGAGHYNALRIQHLAHHTARTVGGDHKDWTESRLLSGDLLQTAKEHVRRGIRTRQYHPQPAKQSAKEWIGVTRVRQRQPERCVGARVPGHIPQREHGGDGQLRAADPPKRFAI